MRLARYSLAAVVLIVVLSGCASLHLAGEYDARLAADAADLGAHVDAFLGSAIAAAGTPEGAYDTQASRYAAFLAELGALRARARSGPVVDALASIAENLETVRQLHERHGAAGLAPPIGEPARNALAAQFRAIATIEDELKRGES
jgi:hypothetical protein